MTTQTHTQTQTLVHPVDRFLAEIASGDGISHDVWTADARLDATVPGWRFERSGPEAVAGALSGWFDLPTVLEKVSRRPVPGGEVVELDLSWVENGVPHAAHQVHVLDLAGERISSDTVFCGGRWPASLLAEMEAARVR